MITIKRLGLSLISLLFMNQVLTAQTVSSPNGNVEVTFKIENKGIPSRIDLLVSHVHRILLAYMLVKISNRHQPELDTVKDAMLPAIGYLLVYIVNTQQFEGIDTTPLSQ